MMRSTRPIALLLFSSLCLGLSAQNDIEQVIVETYYISDAQDATDTLGGGLTIGSTTYRVFIGLGEGRSLRAIYGDENHPLIISSTAPFFNNADRGRTYGHEINNSALDENTVALDSWLSMGAASNQRAGIPKDLDPDGSIIGGANNDGGSMSIPGGLLVNEDPLAGIPIIQNDGLMNLNGVPALPPNFIAIGDDPSPVFKDSTAAPSFISNNIRIGCSTPGVIGATPENLILVAQFTTTGELTFKLNIEVERPDGTVVPYVSSDDVLLPGETPNGLLSYPPVCGCTDPYYLEYDPGAGCDDGSCATTIVFGCLDSLACNFSTDANFHVPQLCCYGPDDCNGLEISIVCPTVGISDLAGQDVLSIAPNPVTESFQLIMPDELATIDLTIVDLAGRTVMEQANVAVQADHRILLNIGHLAPDLYILHIQCEGSRHAIRVLKQ